MHPLQQIQTTLQAPLQQMNTIIAEALATPNQMMNSVAQTYLQVKGKQIRPLLVMLSASMFGHINADVLHAAAALEMLHNASLIHDDVVDETSLRRGVPTINQQWGNQIAVLVGDFFVSNALAVSIRTRNLDIISAISDLGKELSLGEVDQICNARAHTFSEADYLSMIGKKTASLFYTCVKMGAQAVGADTDAAQPLMQYAHTLGLCFQIKDDIFDYFDSPEIGKPTGNDLREGKVSLPLLYALRTAPAEQASPMLSILNEGALDDDSIATLTAFARKHGGIDYAYATMRSMQAQADALLTQAYPDSPARQALRDIFDFIISRDI